MSVVQRLTPQDLMMLWGEDFGWPQHIGALAILDGTQLFDPDGRFRIEAVRAAVERRLHLAPRLRQLPYTPKRGLGNCCGSTLIASTSPSTSRSCR